MEIAGIEQVRTGLPQGVADAADRVDERWIEAVDLLAQVGDVGLDDLRLAVESISPRLVRDSGPRQDVAGVVGEEGEEVELGGGQVDGGAGPPDRPRLPVDHQVGQPQPPVVGARAGASQDGPDPRHQLVDAERLGDVVVTEGQSGQLVGRGVPGRQERYGGGDLLLPQRPTDLEAVAVGRRPRRARCSRTPRIGHWSRAPATVEASSVANPSNAAGGRHHVGDVGLVVDGSAPAPSRQGHQEWTVWARRREPNSRCRPHRVTGPGPPPR